MNIKDTESKINQIDNLLVAITRLLKKHWIILLFLLFSYFIYWSLTLPDEYEDVYYEENISQTDTRAE